MVDTRSLDDMAAALTAMQAQLDDLKSTSEVRTVIRPTGTLEETIRTIPPAGALMCNGQEVSRALYPALFQFAQDQNILGGVFPVFGTGDGSTTFTMPDMTGRTLVGSGILGSDSYTLGQTLGNAHPTIATSQVPPHAHNVRVADHNTHYHNLTVNGAGGHGHSFTGGTTGGHTHGFTTSADAAHYHNTANQGNHGGHFPATSRLVAGGSTYGVPAWNDSGSGISDHNHGSTDTVSAHSHGGGTDNQGNHAHSGSLGTQADHNHSASSDAAPMSGHSVLETALPGAGTIDVRQPAFVGNYMIWT